MKKYFFYALIAVFLFGCYFFFAKKSELVQPGTKQEAIVLKAHSDTFNQSINKLVNTYLSIKDAFVEDDTTNIKLKTTEFCKQLETLNLS